MDLREKAIFFQTFLFQQKNGNEKRFRKCLEKQCFFRNSVFSARRFKDIN